MKTTSGGTALLLALNFSLLTSGIARAVPTSSLPQTSGQGRPVLRMVQSNGIRMRIAEQGKGPMVLLLHGFPELWYSWRQQLSALSEAGFRAVAPDMRGYGRSDAPPNIDDYDIVDLCGDVVGILDALEEESAALIGHDWGAAVAWNCVLLHPARFTSIVAMSVPFRGRASQPPLSRLRQAYGENFFYMLYFQEPGVAEAEFDPDPEAVFRRFFASPATPREPTSITSPRADAGGLLGRIGLPKEPPSWLNQRDFEYYISAYSRSGFRGGLNYYRNFDRSWELTAHLAGKKVEIPALFIAGDRDLVIAGSTREQLLQRMGPLVPRLKDAVLLPDTGHWVQQERAAKVNQLILDFLNSLNN